MLSVSEVESMVSKNSDENEFQEGESSDSDVDLENEQTKRKLDETEVENDRKKVKSDSNKASLYKQPTAEEISRLRETEQLFNSNLFRLQIEQLLDEIKVKEKHKKLFNEWYENIENIFQNLPEFAFKLPESNLNCKNKFVKELLRAQKTNLKSDQDMNVILKKPEKYLLCGANTINAEIGPKYVVNLTMEIPKECLLPGDYLNNRFNLKSSYYSLYIYLNLKKASVCSDIAVENSILQIVPNISSKILVNVHVLPPENFFKLSKLEPDKNNMREYCFNDAFWCNSALLKESGTPFYNSSFLHNCTLMSTYKSIEESIGNLKNVQDGIKLLTIWLQQRGLNNNKYGFSELLLTNVLVYLIMKRKINRYMSSYQVVRNFWVFISTTDWCKNPISLCEDVKDSLLKTFQDSFDVVFIDKTGSYNLAAFLYYDVYMKLRSEAELAVKFVDNITFDSFGGLFMNKMNPEIQYDALLVLTDSDGFKNVYNSISENEKCSYVGFSKRVIIKTLLQTLRRGLNKRILHIVPISSDDTTDGGFTSITFGITLNPDHAFSLIEKGPEANTPEALQFNKFWGKLSECRRFVDGAICEAVYFPSNTVQEKRRVFQTIINYVVSEKFNIEKHYIVADQFEHMVTLQNHSNIFPIGTCEEASLNVIRTFDEISKILREPKLPLDITTIQGGVEAFCYTAAYPSMPVRYFGTKHGDTCIDNNIVFKSPFQERNVPRYVEAIQCVIHLGMNSKWPQDLQALRYVQLGFYLELSKYLKQKKIVSQVQRDCLEVLYKGLVFQFRLYNPKEIAALRKFVEPDGTIGFQDTSESIALEHKLVVLPRLISALHGLQSQNPSFGPSTTIIKKWLRSQLIDEFHVSDIVIDLLNAALFINSAPYNVSNLPQVAFFRFLKFIVSTDWNLQQIVVNFNMELTKEAIDKYETSFQQMRHNYPAICIITPYDDGKSSYTRNCTKEMLNRLSILAKSTYAVVQQGISNQDLSVIKNLFVPNLDGYDFVIYLNEHLNPRRYQRNFRTPKKALIQSHNRIQNRKIPIVNFSPVESYLTELRLHYGSFALFFYDSYGGNLITGLWKPKMLESKPFKVSHLEGRKLENKNLTLNINAIIDDFKLIGDGLVEKIQSNS